MHSRWVIGDIHGCIATLHWLVEKEIAPTRGDTLFLLGDLIDRGTDSKAVIDYLFGLRQQGIEIRCIKGNHEAMLLSSRDSFWQYLQWMHNAGMTTLEDFGVDTDEYPGPEGVKQIPDQYTGFLKELPWYEETDGYFLVHAGLDAGNPDPLSDTNTLIWTRKEEYPEDFLKGRKLIHGHTPVPVASILSRIADCGSRIINLDGGCVYRDFPGLGNLVALDLETFEPVIVPNRE